MKQFKKKIIASVLGVIGGTAAYASDVNLANVANQDSKVEISSNSNTSKETASVKLAASASTSAPVKPFVYHVLNSAGEEVAKGDVSFSNDVTIDLPLAEAKKETFTIKFDDLYEYFFKYSADPVKFEVSPNEQASVDVDVKGEAYPVIKFDVSVNTNVTDPGFDLQDVDIKFVREDGNEVILPELHSGKQEMNLPKNTGKWRIEVPKSSEYLVLVSEKTIDTDTNVAEDLEVGISDPDFYDKGQAKGQAKFEAFTTQQPVSTTNAQPVVKFDAILSEDASHEVKDVTVNFIRQDKNEVKTVNLNVGTSEIKLPKNTGEWVVEIPASDDYIVLVNQNVIDTDAAEVKNLVIGLTDPRSYDKNQLLTASNSATPVIEFPILLSEDVSNEVKDVTVNFINEDSKEVKSINLNVGIAEMKLPKNTGKWIVEVPKSNEYIALVSKKTIDTDASEPQSLKVGLTDPDFYDKG